MARRILPLLLPLALALPLAPLACGPSSPPPSTGGTTAKSSEGAGADSGDPVKGVIVGDSTEVWYEEPSGAGGAGTKNRTYTLEVTKKTEWKVESTKALPPDQVFKVRVGFPVPKVIPAEARDVHVINRTFWEVRKEIAKCYYKGPGKEAGPERTMVAFLNVNKKGEVTGAGVEAADEALKKAGVTECILENIKGLPFPAAGDDTKIRFKLKLQTEDGGTAPAGASSKS